MSVDHERFVRAFLRPSEELAGVLYLTIVPKNARDHNHGIPKRLAPLAVQFDPPYKLSGQLLIAMVKHYNKTQDVEEGGFLFLDVLSTNGSITTVDALPLIEPVSLSFAQNTYGEERWGRDGRALPIESPWFVSVKRDAQDTKPLLFLVRGDNTKLQSFLGEYRRLREIATLPGGSGDFMWIEAYLSNPSFRCLDLRLRNKPLYRRLSRAVVGSPGDNISDISIVRRDWIECTSAQKASTGISHRLKIRLGTFNVNGKPPSQDLSSWLLGSKSKTHMKNGWISPLELSPFEISVDSLRQELRGKNTSNGKTATETSEDPDIFVLGFQELDLSAEALIYASSMKEDEWLTAIFAGLGEKGVMYEKLVSKQLVGMLLVVIVKKTLVTFTGIRTCDVGLGILGFMGNKGATAIRLEFTPGATSDIVYQPTILTFVNAHLAANDEMLNTRNDSYAELSKRLQFPADISSPTTYNIFESDVLFWIGGKSPIATQNLNYRLELSDVDIRTLLSSHGPGIDNVATLLAFDQLKAAIRNREAFVGFTEPPLTHFPTYRLGLGPTAVKNQLGYDSNRKPAWTDRVLYMASSGMQVTPLAYRSHPEITMSDHFPVSADFDISWILMNQSQREKSVVELHRELAWFEESESKPEVKVKSHSVEFGSVKYRQASRREVMVQNEKDIPCVFRFVGSDTDPAPVPSSWLHVEPIAGIIRPKEAATITLTAYVDDQSAAVLNTEPQKIECVLILHTLLGQDNYLVVTGDYEYTCFGNTLERLTRLTGPIRQFKSEEELLPIEEAGHPPKVLTRLTDWMMRNAADEPFYEMFEHPADEGLCQVIRECLDTGDAFPEVGTGGDHKGLAAAIANTLLLLLDLLIDPVVPASLHAECLRVRDKDRAYEVVNEFPEESINVWISLMAFLHFLTQQPKLSQNADTPTKADSTGPNIPYKLATIFAPILLRDDRTGVVPRVSPVGKRNFILLFIE